jgi:hypothetical protein
MGTRGIFGFRQDGKDKLVYNHFDSCPEGLGETVALDLARIYGSASPAKGEKKRTDAELREKVRALRLVSNDYAPTKEDVATAKAAGAIDGSVSSGSLRDTYVLTRRAQPSEGGIWKLLDVGFAQDSAEFVNDSLFCEWGYVVNLDSGKLEVYGGFWTKPHRLGRYAKKDPSKNGYYPIALLAEFDLAKVDEWVGTFSETVHARREKLEAKS